MQNIFHIYIYNIEIQKRVRLRREGDDIVSGRRGGGREEDESDGHARRVSRVPRLFRTCPSVAVNFEEPASRNNEDTSRNDRYAYLGNASTYRVSTLPRAPSRNRCMRSIGTRVFSKIKFFQNSVRREITEKLDGIDSQFCDFEIVVNF